MIGIFDSGLGGLSIYKEIKKILPQEDILYYADTANIPYGEKTEETIKKLTLKNLKYLESQNCNPIVIACNTATTSGLDYYRQNISSQIIGVIPAIKPACQLGKNIALLATPYTCQSKYTQNLINQFSNNTKITLIPCPNWIEAIENNKITDQLLQQYLNQLTSQKIIILGCTHYVLIKDKIQKLIGPQIKIIDSTEAVAKQTKKMIDQYNLSQPSLEPKYIFKSSLPNLQTPLLF